MMPWKRWKIVKRAEYQFLLDEVLQARREVFHLSSMNAELMEAMDVQHNQDVIKRAVTLH